MNLSNEYEKFSIVEKKPRGRKPAAVPADGAEPAKPKAKPKPKAKKQPLTPPATGTVDLN
jgi:hypothetical protein